MYETGSGCECERNRSRDIEEIKWSSWERKFRNEASQAWTYKLPRDKFKQSTKQNEQMSIQTRHGPAIWCGCFSNHYLNAPICCSSPPLSALSLSSYHFCYLSCIFLFAFLFIVLYFMFKFIELFAVNAIDIVHWVDIACAKYMCAIWWGWLRTTIAKKKCDARVKEREI